MDSAIAISSQSNAIYTIQLFVIVVAMAAGSLLLMRNRLRILISPTTLIVAIALIVRLPWLADSFWYDETFTAAMARLPFDRMLMVNAADVHPPLWYMIEWFTGRLIGWSELSLRLPALGFGLLACVLIYRLALHYVEQRLAFIAAICAALMPGAIYYSTEARAYSALVCCVVGMMLAVLNKRLGWLMLLAYITPGLHAIGLVYVAVIGVWALLSRAVHFRTVAFMAIFASPGFIIALMQSGDVTNGFWLGALGTPTYVYPLVSMSLLFGASNTLILVPLALLTAITLLAALNWRYIIKRRESTLLLCVIFGSPALLWLISVTVTNIYLDRALLSSAMLMPILWIMLSHHPLALSDKARLALTIVPVACMAFATAQMTSPRADAAPLVEACTGTDQIYTTSISAAFVASYYLGSPMLWTEAGDLNQQLPDTAIESIGWRRGGIEDLQGRICVLDGRTILSSPHEIRYMQSIADQSTSSTVVIDEDTQIVQVHILER